MKKSKKKILIYSDVPGWAFDNISQALINCFSNEFDWYYDYTKCHRYKTQNDLFGRFRHDIVVLIKIFLNIFTDKYKVKPKFAFFSNYRITFFWEREFLFKGKFWKRRVMPFWKKYDLVILLDYYFDRYAKLSYKTAKLVKGIYTEGFPPLGCDFDYILKIDPLTIKSVDEFARKYLTNIDALIVGCPSLIKRYGAYVENIHFCNVVMKSEIFTEKQHTITDVSDPLIVGWTGNPNRNFKNFNTIVRPAINALQQKGLNVALKTRFSGEYETLPMFYQTVDVVIIASTHDVGPSLFAEASLTGVPAISNNIGFPSFVIRNNFNGILVDLDLKEYVNSLEKLYYDRMLLYNMSKEIRASFLEKMSEDKLIEGWRRMFKSVGL